MLGDKTMLNAILIIGEYLYILKNVSSGALKHPASATIKVSSTNSSVRKLNQVNTIDFYMINSYKNCFKSAHIWKMMVYLRSPIMAEAIHQTIKFRGHYSIVPTVQKARLHQCCEYVATGSTGLQIRAGDKLWYRVRRE